MASKSAEIHEEIIVALRNELGALARILDIVGNAGVNVLALCAYELGDAGAAHLVVDHPAKAKAALDGAGAKYELHPVLVVALDDKPGAAAAAFGKIAAAGVNVRHCYVTSAGAKSAKLVIRTADNGKAKEALG